MDDLGCGICGYMHVDPNRSHYDCIVGMRGIIESKDNLICELEQRLAEVEVKSEKFEEFKFKFTAAVDSIYKTAQPLFELYHEINSQVPEVKGE